MANEVLRKYSIVIGADTTALMEELNKAEKELKNKLENVDLGAGVREDILKLTKQIETMRSELNVATRDINASIKAINTDALKNEFGGLQKIISSDIAGLQKKVTALTDTINILNGTGLGDMENAMSKTFSNIEEKMSGIMDGFVAFQEFISSFKAGAFKSDALENALEKNEQVIKKSTKKQKDALDSLMNDYQNANDKINNVLSGNKEADLKSMTEWYGLLKNIINAYEELDKQSANDILGNRFNIDVIKKQTKELGNYVNDQIESLRDDLAGGAKPDIYLRWKTEVNPDETAKDIYDKIDEKYTQVIQKWMDKKPLKFKIDIPLKDADSVVKNVIKQENEELKKENAPKIKVGLGISGLKEDELKDNVDKITDAVETKTNINGNVSSTITGGNVHIDNTNIATESTLSEIKDILSNWQGSGLPGEQKKEQIHEDVQVKKELDNAKNLIRSRRLDFNVSKQQLQAAKDRETWKRESEYLYNMAKIYSNVNRKGIKNLRANPALIENTPLWNDTVTIDGKEYAKWGNRDLNSPIPIEEFRKKLKDKIADTTKNYFKETYEAIKRSFNAKEENLSLLGVEQDAERNIIGRRSVAIGQDDIYRAAYDQVNALKKTVLESGLEEEYQSLQLNKQKRDLMQQIIELSEKNPESEKLPILKEELRLLTRECTDQEKLNSLIEEQKQLEQKRAKQNLNNEDFKKLLNIDSEMDALFKDAAPDMLEYAKSQTQLIDKVIDEQQARVDQMREKFYHDFRNTYGDIVREYSTQVTDSYTDKQGNRRYKTVSLNIADDKEYKERLQEWKDMSKEFQILDASITKINNKGEVIKDYSALAPAEKERYGYLYNSVQALGRCLNLYREMHKSVDAVSGGEKEFGEELDNNAKKATKYTKIMSSLYEKASGTDVKGNKIVPTESKALEMASTEELREAAKQLSTIKDDKKSIEAELKADAKNYIKERIKMLENRIKDIDEDIKQATENLTKAQSTGNEKSEKGIQTKLDSLKERRENIQASVDLLKSDQNEEKTQAKILKTLKEKSNITEDQIKLLLQVLDISASIAKENDKQEYILDRSDKGRTHINRTDKEFRNSVDVQKDLRSKMKQLVGFDNADKEVPLVKKLFEYLLSAGVTGVSEEQIASLFASKMANVISSSTVENVVSAQSQRMTESQKAKGTLDRIYEELGARENRYWQNYEEKKKQTEETIKKDNRKPQTKIREINKKYNDEINRLSSEIETQQAIVNEAKNNTKNVSEKLKTLKKYKDFNKFEQDIIYQQTLVEGTQDAVNVEKENIKSIQNKVKAYKKAIKKNDYSSIIPSEFITTDESGKQIKPDFITTDESGNQISISIEEMLKKTEVLLQERKKVLKELELKNQNAIKTSTETINNINAERTQSLSKHSTKFNSNDLLTSIQDMASNKQYGKKYADLVLKYITAKGDYSLLPQETSKVIDEYIKGQEDYINSSIKDSEKKQHQEEEKLNRLKRDYEITTTSKEKEISQVQSEQKEIDAQKAEKERIKNLIKRQELTDDILKSEMAIAYTAKNKRTEESDLFSYYGVNRVDKGMSDEQKFASFRVDKILNDLKLLYDAFDTAKETGNEVVANKIQSTIDDNLELLHHFRDEAVKVGLHISSTTGRAVLDTAKDATVLMKDMWTGLDQPYQKTEEQLKEFNKEQEKAKEKEKADAKSIGEKFKEQVLNNTRIARDVEREAKKQATEDKFTAGMTDEEKKIRQELEDENNKLIDLYKKRKANSEDVSEKEINDQKKVIEEIEKRIQATERLEVTKKGNIHHAQLKAEFKPYYKSSTGGKETSSSISSTLPATEKTLAEIRDILKNGQIGKINKSKGEKIKSFAFNAPKNDKQWEEYNKLLEKNGVELKDVGNGHKKAANKERDADKIRAAQEEWNEAHKKNVKATEKDTKATEESAKEKEKNTEETQKNTNTKKEDSKATKKSSKAKKEDAKATEENVSIKKDEKKETQKSRKAKKKETEAVEQTTMAEKENKKETEKVSKKKKEQTEQAKTFEQNKDLYYQIAKEKGWLSEDGEKVLKEHRDETYLLMEERKPGSTGLSADKLEELRKKIQEATKAQKELNKAEQKDTATVTEKKTRGKKKQAEATQEATKAQEELNKAEQNNISVSKNKKRNAQPFKNLKKEELKAKNIPPEELVVNSNMIDDFLQLTTKFSRANLKDFLSSYNNFFGNIDDNSFENVYSYFLKIKQIVTKLTRKDNAYGDGFVGGFTDKENPLYSQNQYTVYKMLLNDIGYTLSDKNERKTGEWSAEIIPIKDKAIDNAREMLNILLGIKARQEDIEIKTGRVEPIDPSLDRDIFVDLDTMFDIGKETVRKFYDGAEAESDEEKEAFKKLAEIPVETMKLFLGIDSPSKVMYQLGVWTGDGFNNGVLDSLGDLKEKLIQALKEGEITKEEAESILDVDAWKNDKYLTDINMLDESKKLEHPVKNPKNTRAFKTLQSLGINEIIAEYEQEQNEFKKHANNAYKAVEDMFYTKNKNLKSASSIKSWINQNTDAAIDAINTYTSEMKSATGNAPTLREIIEQIFGDSSEANKTAIENSFKTVAEKRIKEVFALMKKYDDLRAKNANGKATPFDITEMENLSQQIDSLGDLVVFFKKYQSFGVNISDILGDQKQFNEDTNARFNASKLARSQEELNELNSTVQTTNSLYGEQISKIQSIISEQQTLHDQDEQVSGERLDEALSKIEELRKFSQNPDALINEGPKEIENILLRMQGIRKETVKTMDDGRVIVGQLELANKQTETLEYRWNDVLQCYIKSTKVLTQQLTLWDRIKIQVKKSWEYLKSYLGGYLSAQRLISLIRQGFQYVKELDKALTEMRKVSDETVSSLKTFQKESFEIAKNIGTTATEIQNSAADFMRLGYSLKEASQLAKDANIYANVGDMQISEATEHMISSIQAWQSEFSSATEASMAIIDKYNEIGNNYAITSADIGSAMERSAAALKTAGNTLDESIGLITAGNLIQQDADTTANALKVMSLRIRGSKADLEDMGEETDDLVSSTSKLRNELKQLTGVDIMLDENTYKSTAQIIQEIGANWDKLTNVSQAAALEKLAGKTRASTVAGLIENYKTIGKVAEDAAKSQGSALKENEKYVESIEGRVAKLTTQVQEFWYTLLDSDALKAGISGLTKLLNLLTKMTDAFGSLGTVGIIGGGLAGAFKNLGRMKKSILINMPSPTSFLSVMIFL